MSHPQCQKLQESLSIFFRLNNIMTAAFACNAFKKFADSTGWDAHDPNLLAATGVHRQLMQSPWQLFTAGELP